MNRQLAYQKTGVLRLQGRRKNARQDFSQWNEDSSL